MTVAELIEKLKTLPQDLPAMYYDYEQGEVEIEDAETDYHHYRAHPSLRPDKPTHVVLS